MNYRFTSRDRCGNVEYITVSPKGDVRLMTPERILLSLSNITTDAARLQFTIEDILEDAAEDQSVRISNALARYTGRYWTEVLT